MFQRRGSAAAALAVLSFASHGVGRICDTVACDEETGIRLHGRREEAAARAVQKDVAQPAPRRLWGLASLEKAFQEVARPDDDYTTVTHTRTTTAALAAVLLPSMMNPIVFPTDPPEAPGSSQNDSNASKASRESPGALLPPGSIRTGSDGVAAMQAQDATGAACTLRVDNLSYLGLISNLSLLFTFEEVVKQAIADQVGVSVHDVALGLSAGSVVAHATVAASDGLAADLLQSRLNASSTIGTILLDRLAKISGLEHVSYGALSVSDYRAPLVNPSRDFAPLSADEERAAHAKVVILSVLFGLCLLLLAVGALAPLALHNGWCGLSHPRKTRGLALEGDDEEDTLVDGKRAQRKLGTAMAGPATVAAGGTLKALATGKAGAFEYMPLVENPVEELELVTVTPGGVHIQPLSHQHLPRGVPVVRFN